MMRWPWQPKPETRQSGGGYTDAIVAAIEAQASAKVADVSSTAAIEAAAGALSRAFMAAEVHGPGWVQDAVSPVWLAQVGRSLIREGASLSVIVMGGDGMVELVPAAFWNFENVNPGAQEGEWESTWQARVSTYGPSSSYTRLVNRDRLVFVRWGSSPGEPYRGRGPTSWAHLTARCQRRLKIRPKGGAKDCHLGWWSDLGVRLGVGDAVRGFFGGSGQRSHAELKRSAPAGRPQGGMVYRIGVSLATRALGARCRPGPSDGVPQFSYRHCFCGRGFG